MRVGYDDHSIVLVMVVFMFWGKVGFVVWINFIDSIHFVNCVLEFPDLKLPCPNQHSIVNYNESVEWWADWVRNDYMMLF